MKKASFLLNSLFFLSLALGLFSCETRKPENQQPEPQVFSPEAEATPSVTTDTSATLNSEKPIQEETAPEPTPRKLPSREELKKITPSQEAKRALSADAMKAYRMKPEAFGAYMQTRIPYYRGKGDLKAQNDVVKIEINAEEMRIETAKGSQIFPMK
ncbi:hypothetical protein [Adhaeribacter soli]|uniref:Lipoprotein n=1 Tax=Adhaeribacter soli TaxID=2607655 RepID=A0A5N1IMQ2_9BACT|nr:hypothetical protein [Adhaeribacter soli]KAA9331127.1 hypothetical protein F0P94_14605 [Adhaeribacter soli]